MGTKALNKKFCMMLFLFSTILYAQKKLSPTSPFFNHNYELSWIKPSPDQRYISFQKTYDYSSDTLVLVEAGKRNHILFQTPDVYPSSICYARKGYMFMSGASTAKYIKLPDLKPIEWSGVSKSFFLENDNCIVILKDEILTIYNEDAEVMELIKDVISIEKKDGCLFYIRKQGDRFMLWQWLSVSSNLIHTSANRMIYVDYVNGHEYFIHENNSLTGKAVVFYINRDKASSMNLNMCLNYDIKSPSVVTKIDAKTYFITMVVPDSVVQKSTVDIWYWNDNNLGKKFQNGLSLKFVILNTVNNDINVLDDARFPRQMYVSNNRFLLALDPAKHQDYVRERIHYDVYRYDLWLKKYEMLGTTGINNYLDPNGRYLLSYDNTNWVVFDINTKAKRILDLDPEMKPSFAKAGDKIIFTGKDKIAEYDIKKDKFYFLSMPKGFVAALISGQRKTVGIENRFYKNEYDATKPLLIKIYNDITTQQALGVYNKNKFRLLCNPSDDDLSSATEMTQPGNYLYVRSNYNRSPILTLNRNGAEREVFTSNAGDATTPTLKLKKIDYVNSFKIPLKGLLFYPVGFDSTKKYPMIVGIYEMMRNQSNRYLKDGFSGRVEGMNIKYYLNRGYFVYLPDITYDDRGPGRSALDCVESSLDAINSFEFIDVAKIGLMGHSHGGYETNFIATQSDRFATFVGGAGNSDLVRSYHSFNYDFVSPFYWQFEEQQYRMFKSFYDDKNLYIDNSPVYHSEKVSRPILLWAGTKDENIVWDQSMEFYLGLRRNKKKVLALFYKNDGHSFDDINNREDLFARISDWFDYYLKGLQSSWINRINE